MMRIKIMLMMMLLMVFVFTSCNQENVVPDSAQVQLDLNTADPGADEMDDENTDEGADMEEEGDEEEGDEAEEAEEEEGEEIDPDSLPQQVLDYIVENYPDAQIVEAELYPNGDYEVELDDEVELVFDSAGNFLGEGD